MGIESALQEAARSFPNYSRIFVSFVGNPIRTSRLALYFVMQLALKLPETSWPLHVSIKAATLLERNRITVNRRVKRFLLQAPFRARNPISRSERVHAGAGFRWVVVANAYNFVPLINAIKRFDGLPTNGAFRIDGC